MELLTNPWVIIVIVLSVVIGNIMALKYTAKMKFGQTDEKKNPQDRDNHDQDNHTDPS
ncbi:DUF2897 family protein [Vibrio ostreicida]|uniref:DUF2897 family protein n=1 Tax=Vibrio ostreicida TaxID=526588 RepID=UPI003B5B7BED